MKVSFFMNVIYTSQNGDAVKGNISLSEGFLIFNNENGILARINKDEISSFKINNTFFKKNISIRVNGTNYKFLVKNKPLNSIVNFIKK